MKNQKAVGRLAMRREGDLWVAYYALTDTMEGAYFLGSVQISIVHDKRRRMAFIEIMREAIDEFLREQTGEKPDWTAFITAPEHEKSGRA